MQNHAFVPRATPLTHAILVASVLSTQSCAMKFAASTIHVSKTPGLHITRTKPVMNAECGCSFSPSRASSFSEAAPSLVGRFKVCAVKNFEPRNKRKTNVKTSIEALTTRLSKKEESPVNAIEQ